MNEARKLRRRAIQIGLVAAAIRLGFVAWAPGHVSGDALWYYVRGAWIAKGLGYINMGGAPSVAWMPGWSLVLAGLETLFGHSPLPGMILNALLGSATAVLLIPLGARLFSPAVGVTAACLYAVWPGNVYYAATLMTETLFNFTLVLCLTLLVLGTGREARRPGVFVGAAGLVFGAAAMVKGEPLALLPVLLLAVFFARRGRGDGARLAATFTFALVVAMTPWVVRNWVHFDRIIVTSGNGPANAWLGNHPGATGGQDIRASLRHRRHRIANPGANGYRMAWDFARQNPREEAAILWKKLVLTYGSDADAVVLIRGVRVDEHRLSPVGVARLRAVANGYWFFVTALALLGLATLRSWPRVSRVLVLGVPATWLALHLVFIGGARFHVPETPSIALAAAAGWVHLRDRWHERG